jgi:hypothetical protein
MYVGMLVFEIGATAIDYNLRHLRRCGVVQIDQGLAINGLTKDGKVLADAFDVKAGDNARF